MKPKGPHITLGVGAVLAAGLLIASMSYSQARQETAAASQPAVPASSQPATGPASAAASTPAASTPPASTPPASTAATASPAAGSGTSAAADAPVTYAGTVKGGGSLSVVVKGTQAVGYLCDGHTEAWVWGTADATSVTARSPRGATLTGTRSGGRLAGSISVSGRTWTFDLPTVRKPSGLWRAAAQVRGAKVVAAWIVLPDGSQTGAWTTDGADVTPAPPLDVATGAASVAGTALTAAPIDPATTTP